MSGNTLEEMFETYLEQARNTPFTGWNFEYLTKTGRMVEAPVKWNYYNVVFPYLLRAEAMLDMGTGGGEILSGFVPLPPSTYATEQYKPNVTVARERLEPLGVKVFEIEEEKEPPFNTNLPFDDEFFDLIISRHEAYYPRELMRVLKPEGTFITQQVGSIGVINLKQFLTEKAETVSNWNLYSAVEELKSARFKILEQQEDIQFYRFYDVGAIAYFMKAIPWIIEDFRIDKYKDRFWELHLQIQEREFYDTPLHRFIIVAQKGSTV
ncbi:MAG: class I SAM-dependent methyltransferase [Dehalococcoidales bacterium]|nr:MAG: class I SAM-dependent methyltransferase [Dehalococcoidales bacterium]